MFTWTDRSDRDSDTSVGGWRADEEGKDGKRGQNDEGVGHMLTPADDTGMNRRSKGRLGAERG